MGEFADLDIDRYINRFLLDEWAREEQLERDIYAITRAKVWLTKDGRRLKVSMMAEDHIQNTIGLLRREHGEDSMFQPIIDMFQKELDDRSKKLASLIGVE